VIVVIATDIFQWLYFILCSVTFWLFVHVQVGIYNMGSGGVEVGYIVLCEV
jgi:hypothetical protein